MPPINNEILTGNFEDIIIERHNQNIDWEAWIRDTFNILEESDNENGTVFFIECPWESEHSTPSGSRHTMIFENSGERPVFFCHHSHCNGRTLQDTIDFYGNISSFEKDPDPPAVEKQLPSLDFLPDTTASASNPGTDSTAIVSNFDFESVTMSTDSTDIKMIPIGYFNSNVTVYSSDSKQFLTYGSGEIHIPMICSDWDWWEKYCPAAFKRKPNGIIEERHDSLIKEKIIYDCKKTGRRLDTIDVLETGIYLDDEHVIHNSGNRVFVDGEEKEYYQIDSNILYQSSNIVPYSNEPSTAEDYEKFIDILRRSTLIGCISPRLLTGIIGAGYLSGLSLWRSHAFITGHPGSGKSEFNKHVLKPLIETIGGVNRSGHLSEASIRQSIQKRCTIFIHDEIEFSENFDTEISFIRINSSGDTISKGTPSGKPLVFLAKSTFILMAVSSSIVKDVDMSRFIFFDLSQEKESNWNVLFNDITSFINPKLGARLCKRMADNGHAFISLQKKISFMFKEHFKPRSKTKMLQRYADLYAGPIAADLILSTKAVSDASILEIFQALEQDGHLSEVIGAPNEAVQEYNDLARTAYEFLMDYPLSYKGQHYTIAQILSGISDVPDSELESYGIYKIPRKGMVKLKLKNSQLTEIFKKSGYINYSKILESVPGATKKDHVSNINGKTMRGVEIPVISPYEQPPKEVQTLSF